MISYRTAHLTDTEAIAQLHTQSWQQHYRGILLDTYLDEVVQADRQAIWQARGQHPDSTQRVTVAYNGDQLVGFACLYTDHDPVEGALLDNLHVAARQQGRGIGRELIRLSAECARQAGDQRMYLWVYEQNESARAFYTKAGGTCQDKATVDNPGGGQATVLRYVWSDLLKLTVL